MLFGMGLTPVTRLRRTKEAEEHLRLLFPAYLQEGGVQHHHPHGQPPGARPGSHGGPSPWGLPGNLQKRRALFPRSSDPSSTTHDLTGQ